MIQLIQRSVIIETIPQVLEEKESHKTPAELKKPPHRGNINNKDSSISTPTSKRDYQEYNTNCTQLPQVTLCCLPKSTRCGTRTRS